MKVRCPQCSTVVDAVTDPVRCMNCGFTAPLPPGVQPTPSAAPSSPAAFPPPSMTPYAPQQPTPSYGGMYNAPPPIPTAYGAGRPIGKERSVAAVIILSIITFGIYAWVWQWKISNEMDRFTGQPGRHKPIRVGIVIMLLSMVAVAAAIVLIFDGIPEVETATPDSTFFAGFGALMLAMVVVLVGAVFIVIGLYRLWNSLEKDDQMRGEAKPTSTALLLTLFILGLVVPYVGFILLMVTYGMTQSALNRTWKVYGLPPPPQAYPGTAPV